MNLSLALKILLLVLFMSHTLAQQHSLSPPYTCTTTTTLCQTGENAGNIHSTESTHATQGRPGKRGDTGQKGQRGEKGDPCQCDVADEEAMRSLRETVESIEAKNRETNQKLESFKDRLKILELPSNCIEYQLYVNGRKNRSDGLAEIYPMKKSGSTKPVLANCALYEMRDDGWIVIQKRFDGSINFYKDWERYAQGFGDKSGEFWLGLRTIHQLTNQQNFKLRIDLRFRGGSVKFAEYSNFHVGSEYSKFKLTISGYSGNAGDRMALHNGRFFTTFDADNDLQSTLNCAVHHHGAWWYNSCYHSNLNGRYSDEFNWPYDAHLSSSEMKVHPV